MTLKFYNNNRQGISFTTLQEGLELIRDSLIGAGWFVELDDIDPNLTLKMKGFDENQTSDECFFIFQGDANNDIEIKGYLGNDANEESPAITFPITANEDNRLWLTCDSGAGVLLIKDGNVSFSQINQDLTQNYVGIVPAHFGFLDRASFTNSYGNYAWYLGRPDYRYSNVYAAKSAHNGTIWRQLSDDYYDNLDWNDDDQCHPVQGVFDTLVVGKPYKHFDYDSYERNAGYRAYRGAVNAITNQPELGWFYYLEGRGDDRNYAENTTLTYPLYERGSVKFCATGGASLIPFATYNDLAGNTWMSAGSYGVQFIQVG
jgi:hypothetical protein